MNTWDMFGKGQVKVKKQQSRVVESRDEVDYDDDYQDMVRRVRDKAKAADALKAQGKEPQTKFNPKTGKYYVDFEQDKEVKENAEELHIGDPVIITGDVEFNGKTGDIAEFGRDKRFVVVNLYNYGKHSFHSSDVEYNDYADIDEAGYGRNRGYNPGFASPHAPELGGRRHREDDEGWGQEQQSLTTTWYIRVNGKIIKDKMGVPYQYRGKEAAAKAARTMMAKSFNAGKKFVLTTKAVDDQPENEATLHTQYKRNRFSGVTQRDQKQDKIADLAMSRVRDDVEEGRMVKGPGGVPLDRRGNPIVPKAKPLSMRKWLVVHDGSHGEGGKDIIEAPNAETAWETANEYDLNIISITPYRGPARPTLVDEGVAEGMKADELSRYCEELVAEKGWDAAYKHASFMAQGGTDPSWGSVLKYLQAMKDGINEAEEKRCMQCGMKNCKCPGDSCKCKPIKGWIPGKGFKKAMDEAAENTVPTHRIGLTVTDPNHPMVSKRKETYQKSVRVTGHDREKAINSAIAHARRKGYKVHDHHYIGTVDEGWKSALGGAALAGAMALGGGAHAQSIQRGEDFLPDIVAHITFKVDGQTVNKDINLGTAFTSPGEASEALKKFLNSKGIKYFEYSLERVKPKDKDNLETTPLTDKGNSTAGMEPDGAYTSPSSRSGDYMTKDLEEDIENYLLDLADAGYEVMAEEKVRLDPKCWTGKKIGNPKTKMKGGVRVNNCVPK